MCMRMYVCIMKSQIMYEITIVWDHRIKIIPFFFLKKKKIGRVVATLNPSVQKLEAEAGNSLS